MKIYIYQEHLNSRRDYRQVLTGNSSRRTYLIAVKEILTVFKLIRQASLDDKDLALDRAIDMYMKTQQDLYEGLN